MDDSDGGQMSKNIEWYLYDSKMVRALTETSIISTTHAERERSLYWTC